jgi:hypothetical protein
MIVANIATVVITANILFRVRVLLNSRALVLLIFPMLPVRSMLSVLLIFVTP